MEGLIALERQKGAAGIVPKPKNFLEWLQQGFGQGILDLFLVPYNRKVWGYDPSEMNTEWMGERVATVDLARITSNILSVRVFPFPLVLVLWWSDGQPTPPHFATCLLTPLSHAPFHPTTKHQGKDDASWGPNNTFRFPLRGGTGTIWQNVYDKVDPAKFRFDARVTAVDADARVLTLSDGGWRRLGWDGMGRDDRLSILSLT